MTKQEYNQALNYYTQEINQINVSIAIVKVEYIQANAPYPIGTKMLIEDFGKERKVQLQTYNVDKEGGLEPVYVALDGKCVFSHKPTIIKTLD